MEKQRSPSLIERLIYAPILPYKVVRDQTHWRVHFSSTVPKSARRNTGWEPSNKPDDSQPMCTPAGGTWNTQGARLPDAQVVTGNHWQGDPGSMVYNVP